MTAFHFQGQPRTLRIWDESLLPARPVALRRDGLNALMEPLRPSAPKAAEALDAFMREVGSASVGDTIIVPKAFAPPIAPGALSGPQRNRWVHLASLAGLPAIVLDSNRYGRELVGAANALPDDFAPAIILDASGRVRHTYTVWEDQPNSNLVRLPAAARDYSSLTVHHWDRAASRSALQDPACRSEIIKAAVSAIDTKAPEEEWLIIHHQKRGAIDTAGELKALVANPDRLSFLHWGDHHGTNAFRHIRNVMVLGLWHYSDTVYMAHHLAAAGGLSKGPTPEMDLQPMKDGEHRHNLLQAICRASVRGGENGADSGCTVYMVGKAGKDTKALLGDTFPGAAILDWMPLAAVMKGRALEVTEEIRRRFAAPGVVEVSKAAVRQAVGLRSSQGLAQVLGRADVGQWLAGQGLALGTRSIGRC